MLDERPHAGLSELERPSSVKSGQHGQASEKLVLAETRRSALKRQTAISAVR